MTQVSFIPNSRSVLQQKLATQISMVQGTHWCTIKLLRPEVYLANGLTTNCLALGVVLHEQEHVSDITTQQGVHVVMEWTTTMHIVQDDCEIEFFAFENNALGFEAGQRLVLKINKIDGEDNSQSLGCAFDKDSLPFAVYIAQAAPKGKRSSIKPVHIIGGQTLNREGSTRALIAWLDKHNKELAANFGVEKLVWCEQSSSGRSDRNQVRVFYRVDFADNKKKKVCANASIAIEHMQSFTQRDFYDDMLYRTYEYALT